MVQKIINYNIKFSTLGTNFIIVLLLSTDPDVDSSQVVVKLLDFGTAAGM